MKIELINEIVFKTARSGGKGGQNVNKVETMVEGRWNIATSMLVSDDQKAILTQKLYNKITADGFLLAKSQESRSQLGNKEIVIKKMNEWVYKALIKKKSRIATKPSKAIKEKRLENKKRIAEHKERRKRVDIRNL